MITYADTLVDELLETIEKIREGGRERIGLSTGFASLDAHMYLNKQFLMLITGYPSFGKSEFVDALAVNTALMHGWKWRFYSPEVDKTSNHMGKLIQKKIGCSLLRVTRDRIAKEAVWAAKHFSWINSRDETSTLEEVMELTKKSICDGEDIDVQLIDPWNELSHAQQGAREDVYISNNLAKLRRFNKKYNILTGIIIHPNAVQKDKNGNLPIPTLRDCAGGAMWWNKADYGICVHREAGKHGAWILMQKIKDTSIGTPGRVFLDWDPDSRRFKDELAPSFTVPEAIDIDEPIPFT